MFAREVEKTFPRETKGDSLGDFVTGVKRLSLFSKAKTEWIMTAIVASNVL
jgi:hypothetical protein